VRGRGPSRHGRGAHDERGAALVEFAFVLPVLLMLVLGMVTGGIVYNHKLDMVSAAREGARYGAALGQNECTPTTNQSPPCGNKTWGQLVQSIVVQRSDGDVTTGQVCVALVSGAPGTVVGPPQSPQSSFTTQSDGTSSCYNDGNADTGTRVQVRVIRTGDEINVAVFGSIPITLTSDSTAKFEQ
jgi:Flp pilus assembly protein TadG